MSLFLLMILDEMSFNTMYICSFRYPPLNDFSYIIYIEAFVT
jgi:hypothetical protein